MTKVYSTKRFLTLLALIAARKTIGVLLDSDVDNIWRPYMLSKFRDLRGIGVGIFKESELIKMSIGDITIEITINDTKARVFTQFSMYGILPNIATLVDAFESFFRLLFKLYATEQRGIIIYQGNEVEAGTLVLSPATQNGPIELEPDTGIAEYLIVASPANSIVRPSSNHKLEIVSSERTGAFTNTIISLKGA